LLGVAGVGARPAWGLRETLIRICKLAAELQVDALSCGGDLFEQERFTPDTAEFLRSTFDQIAPLRVFLARETMTGWAGQLVPSGEVVSECSCVH
jgi:hypothetical protein